MDDPETLTTRIDNSETPMLPVYLDYTFVISAFDLL
jgi:hypothetical protein